MNTAFNILFVMPVLRTPTYTRLAYESFMEHTDARHKMVVCMDLDNAEDRKFYEKHGIPYKVRPGWGHWMMANWEVLHAMKTGAPYNFLGLVHNDMVFGHDWLAGLEHRFEDDPVLENYKDTIFSFFQSPTEPVRVVLPEIDRESFGYDQFVARSRTRTSLESTTNLNFLPWVWSFDFHQYNVHCQWLHGGDYGIFVPYRDGFKMKFTPVQFQNSDCYHFGNVACKLHRNEFLKIQTTQDFYPGLARDAEYMEIAEYLFENTIFRKPGVLAGFLDLRRQGLI